MNTQYKKMLNNLLIFFGGNFGSKVLVFLLVPFYTSILSTEQYGQIDMITTTVSLLLPIVTVGLTDALFRFAMSKEYNKKDVFSLGIIVSLIAFTIVSLILMSLNYFFSWNYMNLMIFLLGSSCIYNMISNFIKGIGHTKEYVIIGVIQTFIVLVLNIIFLKFFNYGIQGYVISYFLSYIIPTIVMIFKIKLWRYFDAKKISKKTFKDVMIYSLPLIPTTLSWWIISSSDRYMITYFFGAESNGIYSVANKIPQILYTVITIFITVWQLSSNEVYENEKENLEVYYKGLYKYFSTIGFVFGSLFLISTPLIMSIIARNEFASGWIYAPFLIDAIIFTAISGFVSGIYGSYKKNMGPFISVTIGAILNIVLNLILIPKIGIQGATIATFISYYFITMYRLYDTKRFLKFDRDLKRITINTFILTIQSICLIYINRYKYIVQFFMLIIMMLYNYKTIYLILKKFFRRIKHDKCSIHFN